MMQLKQAFDAQHADGAASFEGQVRTSILIKFDVGSCAFAVRIEECREVIEEYNMTVLPIARPGIDGVINVRGNLIPVVSNNLLGVCREQEDSAKCRKIIVMESAGQPFGLGVSVVRKILLSGVDVDADRPGGQVIEVDDAPVRLVSARMIISLLKGQAQ